MSGEQRRGKVLCLQSDRQVQALAMVRRFRDDDPAPREADVEDDGVDRAQIRAMLALSPERPSPSCEPPSTR